MNLRIPLLLLAGLAAGAACSDSNGLVPPANNNFIDTVTLSAARDTDLAVASGFSVSLAHEVRTENSSNFDFVYNIDGAGKPVFLTTQVLGVISSTSIHPGFQKSTWQFDSIETAPINNYITEDTIHAATGQVWYIRSALVCSGISSPYYGKLEVLSIDSLASTITFRTLINQNCGYHSLRVGPVTN